MKSRESFPSIPEHLNATEAQGILADEPVAQFEIGSYRNFVYLITDWPTRGTLIVDPQADLSPVLQAVSKHGLELRGILLTHTHFDHVAGLPELIRRFPELPIHVHGEDLHRLDGALSPHAARFKKLMDDQVLELGHIRIRVLHTPGHSAGECCFFIAETKPPYLLTGDTAFIRDCGRTDFPDGSDEEMFSSLQRIKRLPPETIILPGHHYQRECASTLAREVAESGPFRCQSAQELAQLP